MQRLELYSAIALIWLEVNRVKLSEDKLHLLLAGHNYERTSVKFGNAKIYEKSCQKLFGIHIIRGSLFKIMCQMFA